MNVVFFQPNFRAAGVEKVNILLANEMHRKGVNTSFLVFKKEGEFLHQLNPEINVIELDISRALFSLPRLILFFLKNRVHFISSYNNLSVLAIVANILTFKRSKIYACEHNTLSIINKAKGSWKDKLIAKMLHWFYPLATGVIAVSQGVADDLSNYAKVKREIITVLHNPVVNNDLKNKSQEKPKHEWLLNKTTPVFVASGRLEIQKNFSLLINAFSQVSKKIDARLLILGEGSLRPQLQEQINKLNLQDKCELIGYVDNPYSYVRHSDVFVLSSDFEGLPTVIIESLACNTAVVSTDCPSGAAEILESGKWGKLVPVGDADTLAQAMLESVSEVKEIDLTERANFFSVEVSTQKYLDFLKH